MTVRTEGPDDDSAADDDSADEIEWAGLVDCEEEIRGVKGIGPSRYPGLQPRALDDVEPVEGPGD